MDRKHLAINVNLSMNIVFQLCFTNLCELANLIYYDYVKTGGIVKTVSEI